MRTLTPLLPWLLALSSCGSPPRPPQVNEATRRPANSSQALELTSCQHQLHNAQIAAKESTRRAEVSAAHLGALTARQLMLGTAPLTTPAPKAEPPRANQIFTVHFDFRSARLSLTPEVTAAFTEQARQAPLIMLRGRTDGNVDSLPESRIARERASAVFDYLVAAGVDPRRIRATSQSVGDHVAENATPQGRSLNRRVEVELYRTAPVAVPLQRPPTIDD